jgi:hypothetical protein
MTGLKDGLGSELIKVWKRGIVINGGMKNGMRKLKCTK